MSKVLYFATFAIGAMIGSVATWHIAKKKLEQRVQEEVKSVKETLKGYYQKDEPCEMSNMDGYTGSEDSSDVLEKRMKDYKNITKMYNESEAPEKVVPSDGHIFVISPDEFAEEEEFDVVSVSYFEDDILADVEGNVLDISKTVGHEALTRFGEYEDDIVHVRNTVLKTDYEISLEARTYSEAYPE